MIGKDQFKKQGQYWLQRLAKSSKTLAVFGRPQL